MSVATFQSIINGCNTIMSYQFNLFGLTFNLWQICLFGVLVYMVVWLFYEFWVKH